MKILKYFFLVFCILLALVFTSQTLRRLHVSCYYRITDIHEYSIFNGCFDQGYVEEQIITFFPKEIESYFENVRYVYTGMAPGRYAFEAFLEFQITDEVQFQEYVAKIAAPKEFTLFHDDPTFSEYVIADVLYLGAAIPESSFGDDVNLYRPEETRYGEQFNILYADIRKVLVSDNDNRIIYVALGASIDSSTNTVELSTFFKRFHIAPANYKEYCTSLIYN